MSLERLLLAVNNQPNKQNCILGAEELKEIEHSEIISLKMLLATNSYYLLHLDSFENDDKELATLASLINECRVANFSFSGFSIGNETARAIVLALENNSTLTTLNFGGFSIDGESLRKLGRAIKDHPTLQEFCILCQNNITPKDLFHFAMQVAQNTNLLHSNVNGFLVSRTDSQSQNMRTFIFEFLDQVLERNQHMKNLATEQKRLQYYNKFARKWNENIDKQLNNLGDIDPSDKYIKLKAIPLKDICLTFIRDNRQATSHTKLPEELEENLKNEPSLLRK